MRILLPIPYLLILVSLIGLACAFEATSLRQESETVYPHIVEYIDNFTLNTNDLEGALNNQLHDIKLGEVKTSYAHITNSTVSLSHYGSERRLEYLTPLKVKVTNDSFTLFVMFDIRVLHTLGGKNYSCNTSIPLVYVNYTKEIDLDTGNSVVSSLSSSYSSKGFKSAVCKQSESAKDKTRIDEAVNSTEGSSIYLELLKSFNRLQEYFTVNAKNEHLSKIYEKNPYQYDYYGFKISINVSTIQATKFGVNGVENRMSGSIAGTTKAAAAPPDYTPGYTSFYSLEFLQNMVAYSSANYPAWKNIKLSRQNMRNSIFKFRLLDFEYLIPSVLNRYPNNYLSDVEFSCDLEATRDMVINEADIYQHMDWRCKGSFEVKPTVRETFVNFVVSMKHTIFVKADTSLSVYVNDLAITNLNFDIIGYYEIIDPALFAFFIEEGLFEFRVYTIGTFFKINNPNKMLKLEPGKGIWIG